MRVVLHKKLMNLRVRKKYVLHKWSVIVRYARNELENQIVLSMLKIEYIVYSKKLMRMMKLRKFSAIHVIRKFQNLPLANLILLSLRIFRDQRLCLRLTKST